MKKKIKFCILLVLVIIIFFGFSCKNTYDNETDESGYKTFVTSDGIKLKYIEMGSGQPLIFIHGYGGKSETYINFMEKFSKEYHCIAFDLRGFGASDYSSDTGIDRCAFDLYELINYLDLKNVDMFGYSMGSQVVFSYIDHFGTDLLNKIIIGDMTPKVINDSDWNLGLYQGWYTDTEYHQDLKLIRTDYNYFYLRLRSQMMFTMNPYEKRDFTMSKSELTKYVAKKMDITPEEVTKMINDLIGKTHTKKQLDNYYKYWKSMCESDYRELLPSVDIPVGLLYADPGSIYSPEVAKYMFSKFPNATLLPMKNSTHISSRMPFIEEILSFLRK